MSEDFKAKSLLDLAQETHDKFVEEGKREKEHLIQEGEEEKKKAVESIKDEISNLESEKAAIGHSVGLLRNFEKEYRVMLRRELEGFIERLDNIETSDSSDSSSGESTEN
jgi:hypothetical protein